MAVDGQRRLQGKIAIFGTELEPTLARRAIVLVPGTGPRLLERCQRSCRRANRGLSRLAPAPPIRLRTFRARRAPVPG